MIDVSESRKQDTTYFGEIAKQMENGGREALLHHLLHLDISDVDLRHTPKTAAHAQGGACFRSDGARIDWQRYFRFGKNVSMRLIAC